MVKAPPRGKGPMNSKGERWEPRSSDDDDIAVVECAEVGCDKPSFASCVEECGDYCEEHFSTHLAERHPIPVVAVATTPSPAPVSLPPTLVAPPPQVDVERELINDIKINERLEQQARYHFMKCLNNTYSDEVAVKKMEKLHNLAIRELEMARGKLKRFMSPFTTPTGTPTRPEASSTGSKKRKRGVVEAGDVLCVYPLHNIIPSRANPERPWLEKPCCDKCFDVMSKDRAKAKRVKPTERQGA